MSVTTLVDTRQQKSSGLPPSWPPQMTADTSTTEKFPTLGDDDALIEQKGESVFLPSTIKYAGESLWQPRKSRAYSRGPQPAERSHRPRKSISEALGSFRTRGTSVSVNAQELAESLKAPISYKLIGLCLVWYLTSALTNTSSKSILMALPKPITLTIVQFAFVSTWCLFLAYLASVFPMLKTAVPVLKNKIRYPSYAIISTALPLAGFQLLGHILSSMSTSQIPVSLVHTIKGLSPLFTVLAYRIFFRIRYARATYLSLIPLTLGVMLACSAGFSTNLFGIICALAAALVFVAQNIFSKKLFNEAARVEADGQSPGDTKLDKLNLLCYCSGLAFILTLPIWFLSEGYPLMIDFLSSGSISLSNKKGALDHGPLMLEFIFNGVFHFAQNIMAFVLLSMISPVSYSVASLIKRVFVVVVAIVWFGNATTPIQAFGIALTFLGLYLYDRNKQDDAADRRANADHFHKNNTILPLNTASNSSAKVWNSNGYTFPPPSVGGLGIHPMDVNGKKEDDKTNGVSRRNSMARPWLPPGTKQESTWQPGDASSAPQK
ncbi:hypothetical protein H112_04728 [Trichophyton rubrum D6]|uniref:Tpt phosphate/phosphoenolpyruvate translocator family protein n=4 Tax=Trichophyton TaxID=5550 RepID=A0A178F3Y0_TRIRU|nr:uncharacterized protein TERG_04491 [Trichophyton rubrum CBS 118892]EZF22272.1 hypothetical protein H100_04736 [Trichophyton rubrum MR850]EZF41421.1 hypothetical protein H102_04724 [Trichophyton rubrum CBS 100081]EZF51996.1 hypothetical protein H103_04729 [Trichophyton rubrum CBS 288.86]EZF62652.1 hypothetical protein H104_04715 [Trichophyton rubrum CBS 289.86]EZF73276.1 hypothetical protein H105_04746 [Trichophyton soudanense CBS 452.61]EZF83900.1 hypothetical protein H110_04725 [Trichophy